MDQTVVYRLDAHDVVIAINQAFIDFAVGNGAPDLPARVLGHSFWIHVHGDTVQAFTRQLFDTVRNNGKPLALPFRCDAPHLRRHMWLEILPAADRGLEVRSSVLELTPRLAQPPLLPTAGALVTLCAWCNRLRGDGGWVELESAGSSCWVQPEGIQVSHGICPACLDEQRRAIDDSG